MIRCGAWETGEETQITYSKEQRILYQQKDLGVFTTNFQDKSASIKATSERWLRKNILKSKGITLKAITTLSETEISAKECPGSKRFAISSAKVKFVF